MRLLTSFEQDVDIIVRPHVQKGEPGMTGFRSAFA